MNYAPMRFIKPFTFCIENLGCAKNQVDAETMIACLEEAGASFVTDASAADLIIVNTCGFIEPAKEQSINHTIAMRNLYPDKKILMTGCLSQRYSAELSGDLTEVDGFFGNGDLSRIINAAAAVMQGEKPVMVPAYQDRFVKRKRTLSVGGSSFIKIGEGCSNNCSYCAIPLIRGKLKSRSAEHVVEDIQQRAASGDKEVCLISQDLGSWGKDSEHSLFQLLKEILSSVKEDIWIRLLYLHPDHFPLDILALMKDDPRLLPYFDIPFQHASAAVLKAMGRNGSPEKYLDLLSGIRDASPLAVFRSTFLVGFPGETDADIEILLDFQRKARLDWAGVFDFSLEEGTKAAELMTNAQFKKQAALRKNRVQLVQENQITITAQALIKQIGKTLDVLIEEPVIGEDLSIGRSYFCAPEVDGLIVVAGTFKAGEKVRVKLTRLNGVDFDGIPV